MSKYTYQLRNVIMFTSENEVLSWFKDYDLSDYLTTEQINVIVEANLFTKDKLANKILRHYYTREIGLETIGLFKIKVKDKLDLIMEKYAPLIYTNSLEYDLLVNEDYTETFSRTTSGSGTSSSINTGSSSGTNTGSGLTVGSDTPQGQISKATILAGQYATTTSAAENTSTVTGTSSNTINNTDSNSGTESFTRHVKGNRGISATYQALIKQYRENILTIYNDIINELNDLFMGVF